MKNFTLKLGKAIITENHLQPDKTTMRPHNKSPLGSTGTASRRALDLPSLSNPRLTCGIPIGPPRQGLRPRGRPRLQDTVETRPRGSAQPRILNLFFCCFQEGFSPNKSFRKFYSGFIGAIQPPSLLVGALERFAVTTGLCQKNKPQLVTASMQNRPASSRNKQ